MLPVSGVVFPQQSVGRLSLSDGQGVADVGAPVEVPLFAVHLVGGEHGFAGVHVGVLPTVVLALGEVRHERTLAEVVVGPQKRSILHSDHRANDPIRCLRGLTSSRA